MQIKAVKLYEKGFMVRSFALGGEGGMTDADAKVRYRSTLQNYLIDTGSEVLLVDTGMPLEARIWFRRTTLRFTSALESRITSRRSRIWAIRRSK